MQHTISFNFKEIYLTYFPKFHLIKNIVKVKSELCIWIATVYVITSTIFLTLDMKYLKADPRVQDWFLISDYKNIILIVLAYITFSKFGPKFMKNQEPYELTRPLRLYNLTQVILSAYIFKELLSSAILLKYSLGCEPINMSDSPAALRMAAAFWWYFITKVIDILDTAFIILRKKNTQISFLHVYHHGTMIFNWGIVCKFCPGGHVFFGIMLNAFVHVVMYTYYFLSTFGPAIQKYLWWKKYLTTLQIVQFIAILAHACNSYFTPCNFPSNLSSLIFMYGVSLLLLFIVFYVETYSKKCEEDKKVKAGVIKLKSKQESNNNNNNSMSSI